MGLARLEVGVAELERGRRDDFNAEHAEHAEIDSGEASVRSAISALNPSQRVVLCPLR